MGTIHEFPKKDNTVREMLITVAEDNLKAAIVIGVDENDEPVVNISGLENFFDALDLIGDADLAVRRAFEKYLTEVDDE